MALKLSEGQRRAIDIRNKNVLVSAAAGSGKTFVLTQRVLSRIIEDRWDIDSFLIVTFTRDAAAEMKGRIVKSIEEKLKEVTGNDDTDNELKRHLEKQLILISRANISTIDAFCSSVVRQNFHKTELDLGYKNPTDTEAAALKKQAVDDALEELLSEGDEEFNSFYNMFIGKTNDKDVVDMILSLYTFADSLPYPEKWFDECFGNYENAENFYDSIWGKRYILGIEENIRAARKYADEAMYYFKYCASDEIPGVIKKVYETIENFEDAYSTGGIDEIAKLEVKYTINLKSVKDEYALLHTDVIKRYLNFVKEELNTALKNSAESKELINILFEGSRSNIKSLIKATRTFMKKYAELKLEKQMAEFNDISHFCLNILRDEEGIPTETAREYQRKFKEIIIDEYQDSNYLQEEILTAVSGIYEGKNNIFMVGDVKQAIYRFRQTTPELFIKKYAAYSEKNDSEELILLSENYRSRKVVLDACNLIFKQIMDERLGNVKYTEDVALNPKAEFPEPEEGMNISDCTELIIADTANVKEKLAESEIDPKRAEAKLVAKRIYEMLCIDPLYIYDKDENRYRAVEKRDIVILVNRRTNAGVFCDELNSIGISCIFEKTNPLFRATEVKNIISLLRLIDNPIQDIDIVNILHSPIYGMSFDDITEIRNNGPDGNIYTAVNMWAEKDDVSAFTIKKFINDLEYYRDFAINNSLPDLISEIYERSNYFNCVGVMENGSFRQANLRLFKEKAVEFAAKGTVDLHSFVEYIEADLSDDIDENNKTGSAASLCENEDAVRIMTVHKSKGLEFPVVFAVQLQNQLSRKFKSNDYIFDRELGIGLKYIDTENRIKYKTKPYSIITEKYEEEEKSEALRLLYVALTRAKEKLIMTGTASSRGSKTGKEAMLNELAEDRNTILPYACRNMADSPLFWILAALKRSSLDTEGAIKQKWVCLENVDSLEELKAEQAVNAISRLNEADSAEADGKYAEMIKESLNYKYPYKEETLMPSKISITEIKRKMNSDNGEAENIYSEYKITGVPKFMEKNRKISSAQLGTIYHTVMEYMDFENMKDEKDADVLIESLIDRGIITAEEGMAVSRKKIAEFISSDLFERIKNADKVFRETPFVMSMKASRLKEYENADSDLVVHGIIDLFFKEGDKLIVVDYKTDRVNKSAAELADKYRIQLELYSEALEKNTGKKVEECIIYSIDKGESINVKF